MNNLNTVLPNGTFGVAVSTINSNFSLIVSAINSLEYASTKSKGIHNYGFVPSTTTIPNAVSGDWCMVLREGNTFPADIWTYNGTSWSKGGTWTPEGIDLTDYATKTELNAAVANSIAQATALVGYYQCTVSGTTLAVTAPGFTLPAHGGNIRIKMSAPATGASTLKINGTGPKTLLYNGAAVSTDNSWEKDEIISVFYDPSGSGQYLASNSQGGGGKAEKIKYDNSQSGLAAENVQGAVDEIGDSIYSYESIDWINKTTSLGFYISSNTATLGQWAKQNRISNYYCRILPIDNNTKYVITASDNNPAHIALLTNNTPQEGVVATDWNEGKPKRINAGESMVIDSGNYSYLYFRNNINSTSSDFKNPKRIEEQTALKETIEELNNNIITLSNDVAENKRQILDVESKLYPYLDGIPEVDYAFSTNVFGTSTSYQHAAIPVSAGEEYIIEAPSGANTFYCFATSNAATSGGAIPFIEGVTSATSIKAGTKVKVTIPDTCTYLLVYNNSNTRPFLIKKESILKKVCITLGYDYITSSGDFGQHQSNFESGQYLVTPRFIKVSDVFICKFNHNGRLRVFYYDSDYNCVGYNNYPGVNEEAIEANTDIIINKASVKYSYVKLLFDTETPFNNGKPREVEAEVRGNLDDNWDVFNVRTSTYHRICVMVNVSDARCSDGITVVNPEDTPEEKQAYLQDSIMMKPNYGVIALPTTYSNTGKPTRLIIYCHGSGTHFTFSNSTSFNTSEHVDTKYWRKEGYAVMDIDGNPMNSSSHAFRPQAMSAYIAAYKWAIEHYNLCRDGILLGGRSMGAGTVMYLLRSTCPIPVIAACANHPTSVAMGKTASSKSANAELRGFILPEGFTFSDGPMTDEETQVFYDNWDKSLRYVPSLALCVDVPTSEEWRKNFIKNCCHANEKNDPRDYEGPRIAACKDLHMVVRAPLKMFACTRDPNNGYQATSQLYMTMLGNAGQQAELRLFDSNSNNYADKRSEHYYELADPNLRTTFTTVYGEEVTDVPVVYVEMLQFWRRYEQNM